MSTADQADSLERRAELLYAARAALAETRRSPRGLGVAELLQFLTDPGRDLTIEEQRSLFADPRLRADYQRLKARIVVAEMPMLAAASTGDVNVRRFDGGTVKIHVSRVPDQIYVLLQFNLASHAPRSMLLESADGDVIRRSLPQPDTDGRIMMVLDQKNAIDAQFLRLISDPTSTGFFLM